MPTSRSFREPYALHRGGLLIEVWSLPTSGDWTEARPHVVYRFDTRRWPDPQDGDRALQVVRDAHRYGRSLVDDGDDLAEYDLTQPQVVASLLPFGYLRGALPPERPHLWTVEPGEALYEPGRVAAEAGALRLRVTTRDASVPASWYVEVLEPDGETIRAALWMGVAFGPPPPDPDPDRDDREPAAVPPSTPAAAGLDVATLERLRARFEQPDYQP